MERSKKMYCPYCGAILENYKYETKKSVITRRTLSHVMSKCIKCDKDYHWLEHRTSSNIIFKAGFSEVI